ncbi:hypothetical protein E2562_038996 [Oryza meyeriana var. granulata]|uniref:Uncharacterized protein n=1 Tax=Oryza meyeriana var. granulata TaxID=110450 RepID=A0A6G1C2R7_9ORYZ|nr:hypothetical protein E2562_038996 [Oryza meyeriana var. granulata]
MFRSERLHQQKEGSTANPINCGDWCEAERQRLATEVRGERSRGLWATGGENVDEDVELERRFGGASTCSAYGWAEMDGWQGADAGHDSVWGAA